MIFAVKKGQYEDMEGSGNRILLDEDEDMMPHSEKSSNTNKPEKLS